MLLQASDARMTSALCAGWSTEEEVWEEVTGIFKAVMSPKEGNVGGFEGRIHAGRVVPSIFSLFGLRLVYKSSEPLLVAK